jgi:DNA-binding beta-propeller fold protein YncE
MRYCSILLCLASLAGAQTVIGPSIGGMVVTGDGSTVRAMVGLRANSLLTAGLDLGSGSVALAPGGGYAVLARESQAAVVQLLPGRSQETILPDEATQIAGIVFSPSGRSMLVRHAGSNDASVWTDLPATPRRTGSVSAPDDATGFALSDDGQAILTWNAAGAVFRIGNDGQQALGATVWTLAFLPDSQRILMIDRNSQIGVLDGAGAGDMRVIGQLENPLSGVPVLTVSMSGQWAVAASDSRMLSINIEDGQVIGQTWNRPVNRIAPVGRNGFAISSGAETGVWYTESASDPLYVPAVNQSVD